MGHFHPFRSCYSIANTRGYQTEHRYSRVFLPFLLPCFMHINKLYYNSLVQDPKLGLIVDFPILVLNIYVQNPF